MTIDILTAHPLHTEITFTTRNTASFLEISLTILSEMVI